MVVVVTVLVMVAGISQQVIANKDAHHVLFLMGT